MIKSLNDDIRYETIGTDSLLKTEYVWVKPEDLLHNTDKFASAGITSVDVRLDSLDPETYEKMTGKNNLREAVQGIMDAIFSDLKVRICVQIKKNINEREILDLAVMAANMPVNVRFIEDLDPAGSDEVVDNKYIESMIIRNYKGLSFDRESTEEGLTACYRIPGFLGTVGFISEKGAAGIYAH